MYERPWNLWEIKQKYGSDVFERLKDNPVHYFRAETGIELIHKEPTKAELIRIMKNWHEMPHAYKRISDQKSLELFGMTNEEHFKILIDSY